MKTKTLVYKYITLNTVVEQMGMKMVKFEENPKIPAVTFDVPNDVTFTELGSLLGRPKGNKDGK